jgi:rare lipoprotein A (peptidoglycan hydrolase)
MRSILMAMLTTLPLLSAAGTTAQARENWRQSCSGAEYVCGSPAKLQKSAKAKAKASASWAWDFGDAPVKKGKSKKYPSVAAQDYNSGSSYQSGKASWYGGGFHGRKTASGETYNMNSLTAAHRSLPFGTRVRVTNTRTGSSVVVRINDRGPFVGGRIIDLSRAAASQIGLTSSGVAAVKVDILGKG